MDNNFITRIKDDLVKKRSEIMSELSEFTTKTKNSDNDFVSEFPNYGDQFDDNAQEVSQYSTDLEAGRILEGTLKDIDSALKAIENGNYGICKYCGNEIEAKRLLIRPFSSACVNCKSKLQNT